MPSGWTRWLMEQFEFPYQLVYAPELDRGDLRARFDVLILVDGAYAPRTGPDGGRSGSDQPDESRPAVGVGAGDENGNGNGNVRPETDPYRNQRGNITVAATLPQLRQFLEAGGTLLTIGSSTRLGQELGLPLANHLVERDGNGGERPLPQEKFYVPSSVLHLRVDPSNPLAWGLGESVDVMFSSSPTFRLTGGAEAQGLRRVGWFENKAPLRSGWAWGQQHLEGGVAIIDARVGAGRLALFGPQVLFRGQPHGTFKFVFNGIVQSALSEHPSEADQKDR
jgi:hypothetical protein